MQRAGAGEYAVDRRQVLDLLSEPRFDLVLCDLWLPGMGGRKFCQELQVAAPILVGRLLFISGDTTSAVTREFEQPSRRRLLSKPFTPNELDHSIAALAPQQ